MTTKRDVRIVAIPNGFVFIGAYRVQGNAVILSQASVIRVWGTTNGLGQIVDRPTKETVLDLCGFVEIPASQVLFSIKCSSDWPLP